MNSNSSFQKLLSSVLKTVGEEINIPFTVCRHSSSAIAFAINDLYSGKIQPCVLVSFSGSSRHDRTLAHGNGEATYAIYLNIIPLMHNTKWGIDYDKCLKLARRQKWTDSNYPEFIKRIQHLIYRELYKFIPDILPFDKKLIEIRVEEVTTYRQGAYTFKRTHERAVFGMRIKTIPLSRALYMPNKHITKRDFFGQEVNYGDRVAAITSCGNIVAATYLGGNIFNNGIVSSITDKRRETFSSPGKIVKLSNEHTADLLVMTLSKQS